MSFVKMIWFLLTIANFADGFAYQRTFGQSEICGYHNGHRKYLEMGESGKLSANNITVPSYFQEMTKRFNNSLTMQCTLELVTCPACIIKLKFNYMNFPSNCEFPKNGDGVCRCDHIILSEPPYDNKENLIHNCGSVMDYKSNTRSVQIKFVYWNNYSDAFHLEYLSERNRDVHTLSPDDSAETLNGVEIASPFFPALYPRDFAVEHVLTCKTEACRIHLIFSDFQLSRASMMEFFDTNGERLFINGATFRPPILISSGPSLMIRFDANGGSDVGYRARASFITIEQSRDPEFKPKTGCGGMVESIGGAITMMNMVPANINDTDDESLFDCIWIIRPLQGFMHLKTHLSLKVETFEKMAAKSEIVIIQGTTSNRAVLEGIESSSSSSKSSRNLVVPISSGLYVRLRGRFNRESRLAIVYTAFSYSKCYAGGEFLCQNQRCIPLVLQCDGFNQCGDGTDEPESCPAEWENSVIDRRWYSHTPNYYFPKMNRFPDLKSTTLAFVLSSTILLFVISCLIFTLYRNGNRVREQEELQSQLQTISQLLDGNNNRPEEIIEPPPNYEAPPTYDEIIKIGMDDQIRRSKGERRSGRKSRLQRPRHLDSAVSYQSNLLETVDDDVPSTSSIGSPFYSVSSNPSHDIFLPSVHLLEIAEAPETTAPHKIKSCGCSTIPPQVPSTRGSNSERGVSLDSLNTTSKAPIPSPVPKHLWSRESKFRRSWILFNSDDHNFQSDSKKPEINASGPFKTQDVDDYFKNYTVMRPLGKTQSNDSIASIKSCFCDSTQSFMDNQIQTTLMVNQFECERCKNLLRHNNRRCSLCGDCIEKLYSHKTCISCSGRISFQDLKYVSEQFVNKKCYNEFTDLTNEKLCNCFPKYPSQQLKSHDDQILPQFVGKSSSCNEVIMLQHKKKSGSSFYSHNCLPLKSSSSDESGNEE